MRLEIREIIDLRVAQKICICNESNRFVRGFEREIFNCCDWSREKANLETGHWRIGVRLKIVSLIALMYAKLERRSEIFICNECNRFVSVFELGLFNCCNWRREKVISETGHLRICVRLKFGVPIPG